VDVISSTQDAVKDGDFPYFKPLIAKAQTKGRGRRGNRWYSPPEGGLYMSFKLPKDFFSDGGELSKLSLVCGAAVSQTVDSYLLSAIKWPNDIYIRGKKVAGILVEVGSGGVIVGIGVNLNTASFPNELVGRATSIFLETQQKVDFKEFTELLLENISENLLRFREEGFKPFLGPINRKLLWRGKRVLIDRRECGKLLGVNEKGFAVIKTCYGEIKEYPYGEISLRRA